MIAHFTTGPFHKCQSPEQFKYLVTLIPLFQSGINGTVSANDFSSVAEGLANGTEKSGKTYSGQSLVATADTCY